MKEKKLQRGKVKGRLKGKLFLKLLTNQHYNTETMGKDKQGFCVRMGDIK